MTYPQHAGGTPAPEHHPSPATLASHAAGTIRAGFDVVVAAHLQTCAQCRDDVADYERLGGQLFSELDPAALGDDALAQTLARLDASLPPLSSQPPGQGLRQILAKARRRWVAPGVWTAKVDTPHSEADRVFLLRVAPGATTARHGHAGGEFTQVLEGALQDGDVIYRAGDFVELDASHTHHPRVHGNEHCLCLFATEGRLVPTDIVGRIAFALANV
jgi:putative transcriptional regulator